jgi:hypothetical protein
VQSSHDSKRLKNDVPRVCRIKEKGWTLPPHIPKIPLNICPPSFILNMIVLILSMQFSLKVPISLRLPQKYQKGTIMKRGQMPLTVNIVFYYV